MDLGLQDRVALVVGASKGIGRGIAEALSREGAKVALASRSRERLEEVAAGLPNPSAVFEADSGDLERLATLPGEVAAELGSPTILVINTGGPPPGGALEADVETWQDAHRELVLAPRVLAEAALPAMREAGWGRIVNVGSSSTVEPIAGLTLSNSYRMAAVGFLKTLSREVAADGVTVNTVATGKFATDRLASMYGSLERAEQMAGEDVPAGRLGTPAEYGDLVAFICSPRTAYLNGTVIPLDGGLLRSV